MGSVGGPLITTFILMDVMSTVAIIKLVTLVTIGATAAASLLLALTTGRRVALLACTAAMALAVTLGYAGLYEDLLERLHRKTSYGKCLTDT